ncbi:MAG TPA: phosphatidylglycerol lysyltransferase domain-containing protein, partial [Acidimicrobiales bacterium]|nr:phosphatidylglycerol lysyltransferase domain-containing protein [Acidimicrobiales bacterium]
GPGILIAAGGLFDVSGQDSGGEAAAFEAAMAAHPRLDRALSNFTCAEDRTVVLLPGVTDVALSSAEGRRAMAQRGFDVAPAVVLHLETTAGERAVRVEGLTPAESAAVSSSTGPVLAGLLRPDPHAAWQHGLDRLADPTQSQRFLASRLLYRRFARLAWWLLLPLAVALALRLPGIGTFVDQLVRGHPGAGAVARAQYAGWGQRLAVAALVTAAEALVLVGVLTWLSRQAWRTLGGGHLGAFFEDESSPGATANDPGRDRARHAVAGGCGGVIDGVTLQAELTDLGGAFFASPGTIGEVVEEYPGRLGLPPVFLERRQMSWIELETGAGLHVRLLMARNDTGPATLLERLAARRHRSHEAHPVVVAALPHGSSWPPPPDLGIVRRRSRRVRRWAALAIALAGVVDLLSAVTPPLRGRLHAVLQILPLAATQAAGAVVALAGIGLLALARGVRRGQHRAWFIAVVLLTLTLALHLVRGGDIEESGLSAAVLAVLLVFRNEFRAPSDRPSTRSAVIAFGAGVLGITVVTTTAVELTLRFMHHPHHFIPLWRAGYAVVGRLVGVSVVALPRRLDDFLGPSLLALGIGLAVVAVLLATRPVVDRRMAAGWAAELRARDVVRRHGGGTLDYFALRSDKKWFFHFDSLVAYAIYGGVCLVSPDPIGPPTERQQVWVAFRRFADQRGWTVAVMGASEDWLAIYRAGGMHEIYIGDEALVELPHFSLAGGHMKGLRQAHNRIAKYGYSAAFHDPSRLDVDVAKKLVPLMAQSRRGEFERGFSMMLGRIFDPRDTGLVLCVVTGPDGRPAAMCQFVPAPGIGGYSLDLMRRDRGEHPNGLIDFALVSSIEHFRDQGCRALSLNFAAMRSVLEGERGDGLTQRAERWALQKMSGFLQIETLWRFNAKYGPRWLPRYIVYDSAEHLVPAVVAILRAESLSEVPVIGRVLVRSKRRAAATSGNGHDQAGAGQPVGAGPKPR